MTKDLPRLPPPAFRPEASKAPALHTWAAVLVLTLLAAGTGIGLVLTLQAARPEAAAASGPAEDPVQRFGKAPALVRLQPVVANLAAPAATWVRVDAALVLDEIEAEPARVVAAQVAGDVLGYLRTLTLAQLEGASSLQHLREDLNERARSRADGKVRELVIETLVVQ